MVVRKAAVDVDEQQLVPARQAGSHGLERLAGGAVAGIPHHVERPTRSKILQEPVDISVQQRCLAARALRVAEGALGRDLTQLLDLRAVQRLLAEHHLEAVVARRVVRARDLQATVGSEVVDREIHHRGRAATDTEDLDPAALEALAQGRRKLGRAQAAVEPEADPRPTRCLRHRRPQHRRIGPAQRMRIRHRQRLADDPADVVLAQDRRIEDVARRVAHQGTFALVELSSPHAGWKARPGPSTRHDGQRRLPTNGQHETRRMAGVGRTRRATG